MYQTHKTYIKEDMRMSDLINENPSLLLFMEHFELDFCVNDKTIAQICTENNMNMSVFLVIGNLYNGFYPNEEEISQIKDWSEIILFLKNSHQFYKNDKYPEIKKCIDKLKENQNSEDILFIEQFFLSYFNEVLEHLEYEDKVAFPYFYQLVEYGCNKTKSNFSSIDYREHHTDIESKLNDLKNLLLKHIPLNNNLPIRRKFLNGLFELEYDLQIHSVLEEKVLLPLVYKIESLRVHGQL